jgi:hypothetical protein
LQRVFQITAWDLFIRRAICHSQTRLRKTAKALIVIRPQNAAAHGFFFGPVLGLLCSIAATISSTRKIGSNTEGTATREIERRSFDI